MTRLRLASAVLLVMAAGCSRRADEAAPLPASAPAPAAPRARVEPASLDLGVTVPSGVVSGTVRVAAPPDAPVTVAAVNTSCDCTSADADVPRTLAAGESMDVGITVDLGRLRDGGLAPDGDGTILRHVVVRTQAGAETESDVVVRASRHVQVGPAVIDFGEISRGARATATARVAPGPAAEPGPVVERVEVVDAADLRADFLPEGDGGELVLEWGPMADAGDRIAHVRLVLRDRSAGDPTVRAVAQVVAPVRADPPDVIRPAAPTDRPVVARLRIVATGGRPVRIRRVTATDHNIQVREVVPGRGPHPEVEILVPVRPPPGSIEGEVVVETDVEPEGTVRVPVRVQGR